MMRALYTAASGMMAQQTNIDNISNNLANYQSTGFKKSRVSFQDLLYASMDSPGSEGTGGKTQIGMGTRTVTTEKMFSQGQLQETKSPWDVAIDGEGFFKVQMGDGSTAYSRDGSFKLDANQELTLSNGAKLGVKIPDNASNIKISADGTITGTRMNGDGKEEKLGQIHVTRFLNPAALEAVGGNLFKETPACGKRTEEVPGTNGSGVLSQGYLEKSNINIVEEMINIVTAQRSFEMNQKGVQAADEMIRQANQIQKG